ncbi:MAG: matrixin family metalloprotease [Hyphomicrobiales bacterium]|nr:matrixin family metalloprotease [Hyphomicrobiales bacterium]
MARKLKDNAGTGSDGGLSGLESGFQWSVTDPGAETELTFSFAEASKNGKVETYSLEEMKAIIDILAETDAGTGLGFTLVMDSSDSYYGDYYDEIHDYVLATGVLEILDAEPDTADIRFTQKDLNSSYGIANYPGNGPGGDVVFDSVTLNAMEGDAVTDFEYELFYHEIGHALGLRHTSEKLFKNGELNDGYFGPGTVPLEDAEDDTSFSHMSYNDAEPFIAAWTAQDLYALQTMYGMDLS